MDLKDLKDDRIASLAVLDFGLFRVHGRDGTGERVIGIQGYLLTTEGGRRILVDTGFPPEYATDAVAASARDGLGSFGEVMHLQPGNLLPGQLALFGLAPDDIDLVLLTHSDIDHIGCLHMVRGAPVLIGAAERALPNPRYFGAAGPRIDWPAADYVPVSGDLAVCSGFTVLSTPGHSPGHLSALVGLPATGTVILTGDAISRPAEVEEKFRGSWDEGAARDSAARLLSMARERDAFVLYGHCPVQWPTLRKAPAVYA